MGGCVDTVSESSMRKPQLHLEAKHYTPSDVELGIYELWEKNQVFAAGKDPSKKPFTIVIPPPNVTGRLHMGHALNNTIQDLLIRYKRMDGFDALWIPGTDHAGIATQTVVKKQLQAKGISHSELGREKFLEKVWEWKQEYGDKIYEQLRRLGCSCDWSKAAFTMDANLSKAVLVAFKKLYDAGLIYRGKYIVNWCPLDKTALSDDEVLTKDGGEPGFLWYLRYPLVDGSGHITVATTRPETMLGDVAVAVNPTDERYAHLVGKMIALPLVGREIPILADDFVEADFGTGCVKITPAHDPNDFQMGLRHNLAQINIMNDDATMNEAVPTRFQGMSRFACRDAVVAEFDQLGLLESVEERMTPVGRSYRSKEIIEYRLSDQWFVKMAPLAEQALAASEANQLSFYPERWDSYYRGWLGGIRDWCISRQLWWGHRIPAWYNDSTGEILVDVETPAAVLANPDCWRQDEDVLDTWFSSALWPYSTLGWPDDENTFKRYFPTDVLVTGKDIIFFWVSRMVTTSLFNTGKMPFSKVIINSIVCDEKGETMSKSKGNGMDPLQVIAGATADDLTAPVYEARPHNMEELLTRIKKTYPEGFPGVGADSLRYTLLTSATDSQQIQASLKKFDELGRPLTTKIWNAGKLVCAALSHNTQGSTSANAALEDEWIISRANACIDAVRHSFDSYALHLSTEHLHTFFWDNICDWYLELVKPRLRSEDVSQVRRVQETLAEVFSVFLRLLHPIMPFITEEMWGHVLPLVRENQLCTGQHWRVSDICALSAFPTSVEQNLEVEQTFELMRDAVRALRSVRASAGLTQSNQLETAILISDANLLSDYEEILPLVHRSANLKSLEIVSSPVANYSVAVVRGGSLYVNVLEHLDIPAEIAKNEKAAEKVVSQIAGLEARLSSESFVNNAPAAVVAAEQGKLAEAKDRLNALREAIEKLRQ
jgi:valyl-tRNA synthetase